VNIVLLIDALPSMTMNFDQSALVVRLRDIFERPDRTPVAMDESVAGDGAQQAHSHQAGISYDARPSSGFKNTNYTANR
jgi:hypothetical protein